MSKDINAGDTIKTEVRQFVLKEFPSARKREIRDSDTLIESGIVESLGILQIVMFIEERFSIQVLEDDLVPENFQTIDRIATLIERRTTSRGDAYADIRASSGL